MFDHFIVYGLQSRNGGINFIIKDISLQNLLNSDQEPEIQHIYPKTDTSLFDNLKLWCFPEGIIYYTDEYKSLNKQFEEDIQDIHSKDQLFHFVLTNEKGKQRYCTTLLYYERIYVRNQNKHDQKLSKCFPKVPLKQIINNPLILDEDTQIIYAPKAVVLMSSSPIFDLGRQFLVFLYNNYILDFGNKEFVVSWEDLQQFDQLVLAHGLSGAENEWNQRQIRFINKNPIILYDRDFLEFYISVLFSLKPTILKTLNSEVRITRFEEEFLRFRIEDQDILSINNFAYRPLFSRLSLVNIMRIVISIIFERQILFFSSNPGEISQITEGLLSFIKPLQWDNIYIPCSNIQLWEHATALQPYMMGFDKKHKDFITSQLENKVIVDLDSDQVIDQQREDEYGVPELLLKDLKQQLKQIAVTIKYSPQQKVYQWMEAILKTKKSFFNFMLNIIDNVIPFIKPVNQREQNNSFMSNLKQCFDLDGYIKAHKDPKLIEPIAKNTMMFGSFISTIDDYLTYEKQDIDKCVLTYINYMKQDDPKQMSIQQDKEIERHLYNFQTPQQIDLYQWFIKYKKFKDLMSYQQYEPQKPKDKEKLKIILHFYDENSRQKTRHLLNKRENRFNSFSTQRIVDLNKVFTEQRVEYLVQTLKVPLHISIKQSNSQRGVEKKKNISRSSFLVQPENKDDLKRLVGVLEQT